MTPTLIAIHGRKGSGKDTVFEFVQEWAAERGVHAARRGFADLLKLSVARIFYPDMNVAEARAWCDRVKHNGMLRLQVRLDEGVDPMRDVTESVYVSGRELLQRFGTESHRDVFGENFWVDQLLPFGAMEIATNDHEHAIGPPLWVRAFVDGPFVQDTPEICVITDLRFENEAQRVHDLGGMVWQISRADSEREDDPHSSEAELRPEMIDLILLNDSTLERLRDLVFHTCDAAIPDGVNR